MPERIKKIRSHSNNITDKWFPQSHSKQKSDFKTNKNKMKVSICQNKQKNGFTLFHYENFYIFLKTKEVIIPKRFSLCLDLTFSPTSVTQMLILPYLPKKPSIWAKIKENTDMLVELPLFCVVRDALTVLEEKP